MLTPKERAYNSLISALNLAEDSLVRSLRERNEAAEAAEALFSTGTHGRRQIRGQIKLVNGANKLISQRILDL